MSTVLVVDDERKITDVVRDYLVHAGFAVATAGDIGLQNPAATAAKSLLMVRSARARAARASLGCCCCSQRRTSQ